MALQSRLAEGGSKPPQGALVSDRRLERCGKGVTRSRQVRTGKMSDEREFSAVDVSKDNQMTSKPGLGLNSGNESGRYPLTAQVVSGI